VVEKHGLRPHSLWGHHAGKGLKPSPGHSVEETRSSLLPLATEDAIDRALGLLEEFLRDEGSAVPPDEDEAFREAMFRRPGELNYFGNVGEVVQRESDSLRFKVAQFLKIVIVSEDLQVEEPHIMTSRTNGLSHSFQT
jgi:hypothetical protein